MSPECGTKSCQKVFQQGTDLHDVAGARLCPIYVHAFANIKPEKDGLHFASAMA
jgi:hypothetical protein